MIPLFIVPFFFSLLAVYFLIRFYYLKTVYVINQSKTVIPPSESYDLKDVQKFIQIIKARRESKTSLNKFCSSSSLDDLSEVLKIKCEEDQVNLTEMDDRFTQNNISDLNQWLENSGKVLLNEFDNNNSIQNDSNFETNYKEYNKNSTLSEPIKYLNLNIDYLNGEQLELLASLSYLVNEGRLSVLVCKLKLPFIKNIYQQYPLYKKSNQTLNQNHIKIYQQNELIKKTKYVFVKIHLIDSERKRISKKTSLLPIDGQTTILNNNSYYQNKFIIINEMMIFKLPIDQLSKTTIRLSVLGLSSLTNLKKQMFRQCNFKTKKIKKSIDSLYSFGYVEIGYNSLCKSGFIHFQKLLSDLRKPVCMWHCLDLNKQTRQKLSSIS